MLSFMIDYDKYLNIGNPIDLYMEKDTLLYKEAKSIRIK